VEKDLVMNNQKKERLQRMHKLKCGFESPMLKNKDLNVGLNLTPGAIKP